MGTGRLVTAFRGLLISTKLSTDNLDDFVFSPKIKHLPLVLQEESRFFWLPKYKSPQCLEIRTELVHMLKPAGKAPSQRPLNSNMLFSMQHRALIYLTIFGSTLNVKACFNGPTFPRCTSDTSVVNKVIHRIDFPLLKISTYT
jgi:hypothetical protein